MIKLILEEIGCHNVKIIHGKRVQSARPDGDNATSISIKLDDKLSSNIYTKQSEFEKLPYRDFYDVISFITKQNFNQCIGLICKICNIKYNGKIDKPKKSSRSILKKLVKNKKNIDLETEEIIFNENIKEQFVRKDCALFLFDGICSESQQKFEVSYDTLDNRVVFPIRNYNGEIITFKGRTCYVDYKEKGIPKYIYYYNFNGRKYLYGYYENYFDIISENEVYIFEAEKGVMQCDTFGVNNVLAVNKKIISKEQLNKLLSLNKDIVLAFDKGVTLEEIFIECRKFKGLCNVYYIYDYDNLLKDKESPSDNGYDVFYKLSTEYKFKYMGE